MIPPLQKAVAMWVYVMPDRECVGLAEGRVRDVVANKGKYRQGSSEVVWRERVAEYVCDNLVMKAGDTLVDLHIGSPARASVIGTCPWQLRA